jgi:AcrR family transcriptional regulator
MSDQLDARAKRSQQALLRAGLELLNINSEASLSDIAIHAGVGRTTLYRQYETREKLITAIAIDCLETIDKATATIESEAKSALDAIQMLFDRAMPLTQEFQFLMNLDQLIEDDPEITKIHNKQNREIEALVEYGQKTGEIDTSFPISWLSNLIESLFYIGWRQQYELGFSPEQTAKFAFNTFIQGVSSLHRP